MQARYDDNRVDSSPSVKDLSPPSGIHSPVAKMSLPSEKKDEHSSPSMKDVEKSPSSKGNSMPALVS